MLGSAGVVSDTICPLTVIPSPGDSGSNTATTLSDSPRPNSQSSTDARSPVMHWSDSNSNPVRTTSKRCVSNVSSVPMMSRSSRPLVTLRIGQPVLEDVSVPIGEGDVRVTETDPGVAPDLHDVELRVRVRRLGS